MVSFSLSQWLRLFPWPKTLLGRRKPRRVRISQIEGLEDRSMLTANLPIAVADTYNVNEDTVLNASSVLSNDTDADGDTINRAVLDTGTSHGSLSLNSDGTFVYTPNLNYNGVDTFTYFARDSANNETSTVAAVVTINVASINDLPVGNPASATTNEDQAVGGTLTGTDADGNPLTFLAGSAAPAHGVVVINPNGTYTYTPTANFHGADTFSFKVNDGTANGLDATVSVTVSSVNDVPVATAANITVNEDGAFSGTLTGSDGDGDPITFSAGTVGASHGTVVINPNGSFVYTPTANYNGSDTFSFKVNDGANTSPNATISVTVTPVNDLPVATAASITLNEDAVFTGTLAAVDLDGDSLTFQAGTVAALHGTVVINPNGSFTYTPAANYNGNDTFNFRANDGTGSSANASISVTITAVNDTPVATPANITLSEDGAFSGTLVATDADGTPLTYSAGTIVAAHGAVVINTNGSFTFTPVANYNGSDAFSFKASDGTATSTEATISLTVTSVNDVPSGTAASITLAEDGVFSGTLTGTDADGDALTFQTGTVPALHGAVVINPNGSFTYTPVANYNGSDTFTFRASDGTASSANATISVTITAVNDAPVATAASATLNEDGAYSGTLAAVDVDGNPLTFSAGTVLAAHGVTVINANGSFIYTPDANYNGSDTFSFKANDGTVTSAEATMTMNITAVNDAPVGTALNITVLEDGVFSGTLAGTDADGDALTFVTGTVAAAHGTAVINSNGSFTYTPQANYAAGDTFTFKANDGTTLSANATVTVTVTAVNDVPVTSASTFTVNEDGAYSGTLIGTDLDGDPLTFSPGTISAAHGVVVINPNGSFIYTPAANYNGSDTFSFKASDGTASSTESSVSVTITPVNDLPVGTAASITLNEDGVFSGTLTGTDVDGDPLTFLAGTIAAAHGTAVINSNGSFTYTPTANFNGSDTFHFRANDGTGTGADAIVSVTVTPVADPPVANTGSGAFSSITVNEDGAFSGTLVGTDPDGSPLTFLAGASAAAHGTLLINPNGSFVYTPAANYHGGDSFSFKVSDGTFTSADATISVTVTSVNDVPVVTAAAITTNEDTVIIGTLSGTDADGDPLTFSAGSIVAAHGTVVINPNGSYSYTPHTNYNGTDTFRYRAGDGTAFSPDATVSVTILPVNDAPFATSMNVSVNEDTTLGGTLTGTDTDGDPITYLAGTIPAAHGTAVINSNGTFTYTPNANYFGIDTFTFRTNDGTTNSANGTVTVTVAGTSDAPTATPSSITVNEDSAFSGTLTGTDPDGDLLTFSAGALAASHGTVVINPNGTFTYTPHVNFNGTDSFSFRANDGNSNSTDATMLVSITAVNDVPVANPASITMNEDTPFNGALTGSDVDGTLVTFLAGTVTPNNGTLTINPNGTFTYTPRLNFNGADVFSFQVNDGTVNSPPVLVTVNVLAVNDTPVATAASITIVEDSNLTGVLNATDAEGSTLTFAAGTIVAAHGTAVINSNGTFSYTPSSNFHGTDSFSFTASDGASTSAAATVTVIVTAVNDAPTVSPRSLTTSEGTTVGGTLSGTDLDGDALVFSAGNLAATHGTVIINSNGTFSYTPFVSFNGTDSFSYKANDGTVNSGSATVTITVLPVNDAPVGNALSRTTPEDTAISGTLTGSDVEGDPLTFSAGTVAAAHGTAVINPNGTYTYTPNANYNGTDSFTFKVSDGSLTSANATVSVTITAVQDVPVATPPNGNGTGNGSGSITTPEDTPFISTLIGTDPDGDTLTFLAGSVAPTHGTLVIGLNGAVTYTPHANYSGSDSFSFKVNDGHASSADAVVNVTVTPVNDVPLVTASSITVNEDAIITGNLNGTDADGDPLTFSSGTIQAAHGTVVIGSNGSFSYTPNANYHGTDAFSFRANDGTTNSLNATVAITITSVNDLPAVSAASITTNEDSTFSGILTGFDLDGDVLTFSAGNVAAAHGTVVVNPNGSYTYTPLANFNGSDAFSVKAHDGTANSANAIISVVVTPVNDVPQATAVNVSINEDAPLTGTLPGTDADGDPVSFLPGTIVSGHGTTVINSNGTFAYTPVANFNGIDTFSYKVNDGTATSAEATVTITIVAINDLSVANSVTITTNEDTPFTGTLTGTDLDGDLLTFSAGMIGAAHGTVTINSNGAYVYTPTSNFNGTDSFHFKTHDGSAFSAEATVSITVRAVNDAPVANGANFTTNEDTAISRTLTGSDADGDPLTFSLGTLAAAHGTLVLDSSGTFNYLPHADYHGSDAFSFKINDGTTNGAEVTVTITITPVNDAPIVINGAGTLEQNATYNGSFAPLAFDPEGDVRSFNTVIQPANGRMVLSPDGTFVYTPTVGFSGMDTCTFQATDGQGVSNLATFTLHVTDLFVLQLSEIPGRIATSARAAVPVDSRASLINVSSSVRLGNASITAGLTAGADIRDQILVRKGVGSGGGINVRGKRIFYHGSEVARITGGRRGAPLQISFNSSSNLDVINTVLQRIAVKTARSASRAIRTLQIQVRAGGEVSTKTINASL